MHGLFFPFDLTVIFWGAQAKKGTCAQNLQNIYLSGSQVSVVSRLPLSFPTLSRFPLSMAGLFRRLHARASSLLSRTQIGFITLDVCCAVEWLFFMVIERGRRRLGRRKKAKKRPRKSDRPQKEGEGKRVSRRE